MRNDAMQNDAMWNNMMWNDAMRNDAMWNNMMRIDTMQNDRMGNDEMWNDAIGNDTMRNDALRNDRKLRNIQEKKQEKKPLLRPLAMLAVKNQSLLYKLHKDYPFLMSSTSECRRSKIINHGIFSFDHFLAKIIK